MIQPDLIGFSVVQTSYIILLKSTKNAFFSLLTWFSSKNNSFIVFPVKNYPRKCLSRKFLRKGKKICLRPGLNPRPSGGCLATYQSAMDF